MYTLKKLNVIKIVEEENQRDKLISKGFEEVLDKPKTIQEMNVKELREIAKEKGIEGYLDMKKEELLKALQGDE